VVAGKLQLVLSHLPEEGAHPVEPTALVSVSQGARGGVVREYPDPVQDLVIPLLVGPHGPLQQDWDVWAEGGPLLPPK
jgi:hypothetical protein